MDPRHDEGVDAMAARDWKGADGGLTARIGLTFFGLGLLYAIFIGVVVAMGASAVVVLLLFGGFAFFQVFFGDKLAMRTMKARYVTPEEAPEYHAMVDRLCQLNDIAKPKLAIADTEMPNAFAMGRSRKKASVTVTTGLVNRLEKDELEGVIAHEIGHIVNRDVLVMTIAGFLATLAALVVRMGLYSGMGRSRGNGGAQFLVIIAASAVVYALSYVLLRALSRYREYAADRTGAQITGKPSSLASALNKIASSMSRIPQKDLRAAEGMNAFFVLPALPKGMSLSKFFSTHPPTEERVARLMQLQGQMDSSGQASF
jgi:heat shock protein HtpX